MPAKHLFAPLAALFVAACITDQPPPLLTITQSVCAATPDLSAAYPVLVKTDSPAKVTMDHGTACLQPPGGARRLYAVFRLPTSAAEPFSLSVTSEARGLGVFAPYLVLLDENGVERRVIPHDRFLFRGNTLQAGFRPLPGETYLLVASDPEVVGQQTTGIVGSVNATPVSTGYSTFIIYTGIEATRSVTRAHSGIITVAANPLPKPVSAEGKTSTD